MTEKVHVNKEYMKLALSLAEKGAGNVSPNPMVGAVIVKDGRVIGQGFHERYGGLHAERNALADCRNRGEDPGGADIYVTLEPCCHHGKTPPCTDALIESGIARVITGSDDPNPLVAGKGLTILRDHGIQVVSGVLKEECDRLNRVFFHYITSGTPYVVMKYAMTQDGKIAAYTGQSRWITGKSARENVHRDRNRFSAIMVGIGTVIADDPLLTCRMEGGRNPIRIICDTDLRIPFDSQIVKTAKEVPVIIAAGAADMHDRQRDLGLQSEEFLRRRSALTDAGCQVLEVPCGSDGHLDIKALMRLLGQMKIDSILLEGGRQLNWAALSAGTVNLVQTYISPMLLGGKTAPGPIGGQGFDQPASAVRLKSPAIYTFGQDILLESEVITTCSQEL